MVPYCFETCRMSVKIGNEKLILMTLSEPIKSSNIQTFKKNSSKIFGKNKRDHYTPRQWNIPFLVYLLNAFLKSTIAILI